MRNKLIRFLKNSISSEAFSAEEKEMLKAIETAFCNGEFKMYLQFIVDNKEKKLAAAEALSRWELAAGSVVPPGNYLGLMERSGLITRFDYYMFEAVCRKLTQWNGTEFGDYTISCNFTRITLSEKDFIANIKSIADKYDFDRSKLLIEITEDSIEKNLVVAMDNTRMAKELGFRIALDDIGSGYTSLISLCEYPIDVVKIDRDVLLMANGERGKKLFLGIISLAHYLNLEVVCEGVETEEQNILVGNSECDYIQGWYYTKALPEAEAEAFAREYMSKFKD